MKGIILAAGKSKRYGKPKYFETYKDKTFVEHNIDFLLSNNVNEICIVINQKEKERFEIIKEMYINKANIVFTFQDRRFYGPAAGLFSAEDFITEDFVLLFSDNYYEGTFDFKKQLKNNDCLVTYREMYMSVDNLRYAYINDSSWFTSRWKIIEKPHKYHEGKYFCGFIVFSKYVKSKFNMLRLSKRGEYEITSLVNSLCNRKFVYLDMNWFDITYKKDLKIKKRELC